MIELRQQSTELKASEIERNRADNNLQENLTELEQRPALNNLSDCQKPIALALSSKPDIPEEILAKWQKVVDLIAEVVNVPAALIMKVHPSEIEVFVSSVTESNLYKKGEKAKLNTGLYCETVMAQRAQLLVPDARKNPKWADNLDIELGIVSYLGLPLEWPDGEIFGTICVLDRKENPYLTIYQDLLWQFKEFIEMDMKLFMDDIERKRVEEELRGARNYLNNIIENSLDCIYVNDSTEHITRVNKSFLKLFGYKEEEVIGKHLVEFAPKKGKTYECTTGVLVEINEEFLNNLKRTFYRLVEEGKVSNWESYFVCKDKKVIPVDSNIALLYNKGGDRIGAVGIIRDITERKKLENEIREARDFLESVFESSMDGIIATDEKGYILSINAAVEKMSKFRKEELIGKHASIFTVEDEEMRKMVREKVVELLEKGFISYEAMQETREGEIINVECNVSMIKDDKGNNIVGVTIVRDITERKRAEEEIRKSREILRNLTRHLQSIREEERSRIAREIHDDLGQILTTLKMDLSWLKRRLPQGQKLLFRKIASMSGLVDETIQTVQKISTELRPSLLDNLGLAAAVEWQAEEFQKRTGIRCEVTLYPDDIIVDKERSTAIFRILQETLTNVIRHANATGVRVSLKKENGKVVLKVRDNGKGITPEQISDLQSFGLIGMRERVHFWGGEVKINGIRGKETTVAVSIPLDK